MELYQTLKHIYKPKYIALNVSLGVIYFVLFFYLASVQGGGSIMLRTNPLLIFGLIATSSVALTIAIYSIKNTRKNYAKANGTAASLGTLVAGTGLCGCTTTFPAVIAAGIGVSSTGVYALSSFQRLYSPYIFSVLIAMNILVIAYYSNKLSRPACKR